VWVAIYGWTTVCLSLKADAGDYVANITRTYGALINISINVGGVANAWKIEGAGVWGE
jgi:hypothetical protein